MAKIIPFDANRKCSKATRRSSRKLSIVERIVNLYKNNSTNIVCGSLMYNNAYNHRLYCALYEG
jgi:hypothetical protein